MTHIRWSSSHCFGERVQLVEGRPGRVSLGRGG